MKYVCMCVLNRHIIMVCGVCLVSKRGMYDAVCICSVGCVTCVVWVSLYEHAQAGVGRRFWGAKVWSLCGRRMEGPPLARNHSYYCSWA